MEKKGNLRLGQEAHSSGECPRPRPPSQRSEVPLWGGALGSAGPGKGRRLRGKERQPVWGCCGAGAGRGQPALTLWCVFGSPRSGQLEPVAASAAGSARRGVGGRRGVLRWPPSAFWGSGNGTARTAKVGWLEKVGAWHLFSPLRHGVGGSGGTAATGLPSCASLPASSGTFWTSGVAGLQANLCVCLGNSPGCCRGWWTVAPAS